MPGEDLGRYSFRPWFLPARLTRGSHAIQVRATAVSGEMQPTEPRWNPAGTMRNVAETITVEAGWRAAPCRRQPPGPSVGRAQDILTAL